VIGNGKNFIKTMCQLFKNENQKLNVVNDQIGRLTFCSTLVKAIFHLLKNKCEYGIYNISNSGDSISWGELAKYIAKVVKFNINNINLVSTEEYRKIGNIVALRPKQSTLSLQKIESTGFKINN
jgi:dTDP-4-dehydrorhamnose 3,5-epimerase